MRINRMSIEPHPNGWWDHLWFGATQQAAEVARTVDGEQEIYFSLEVITWHVPRPTEWGAVKIGIVLFGNGVIMPDGKTVSPAILSQPLTFDLLAIETIVGGCTQLRLVPPGVARCVADSFVLN
jgi:hypothetical protein